MARKPKTPPSGKVEMSVVRYDVTEAMDYLTSGGLGEVMGRASVAADANAPTVQLDTDLAIALCVLANRGMEAGDVASPPSPPCGGDLTQRLNAIAREINPQLPSVDFRRYAVRITYTCEFRSATLHDLSLGATASWGRS